MKRDTVLGTFVVASVLCVVCSVVVSVAAVSLRPLQEANKERFKKKNILLAAGLYEEGKSVDELFKQVETKIVDLETGDFVDSSVVDPATYDQREAAKSLDMSVPTEGGAAAQIKRREKYSFIYFVKEDGKVTQIILPVYGKGLWSTMYGFLALEADTTTVSGLTFYSDGETPGLGGEINNPKWKAQWRGKKIYDPEGNIRIEVIKGKVSDSSPLKDYEVDGLSGATITSVGVTALIHYWLSADAFGPFLEKFRAEMGGSSNG